MMMPLLVRQTVAKLEHESVHRRRRLMDVPWEVVKRYPRFGFLVKWKQGTLGTVSVW